MADRITIEDLKHQEELIKELIGFKMFECDGRYHYIAIDEYNADGICIHTYRSGLTKRQAYNCLKDILNGIKIGVVNCKL